MDRNSESVLSNSSSSAPTETPSCPLQQLSDEQHDWKLIKGEKYRKNVDLLLDKNGNTFKKRSPSIWQCTKSSNTQKKKCPVLVKEKVGHDGVIRYEIIKSGHKMQTRQYIHRH